MLYSNVFAIAIGAVCNVAIFGFSLYINILYEKDQKEKLLQERNKLLEAQDKLIRANEAEKYKSYQKSKEAEEKIRQINHDLNHHFNYILTCIDDKEKIRDYIYELKGATNQITKYFDTGSSIVDIILQEQCEKAEKLDIKFAVMGGFEEELKIEPAIASVIFGNLLNNAVEGASKLGDKYKKINVTFYQEPGEEFFLEVSNTAECKNLNIKDGKIETSKEDKDSHGIGLRSVRQAVESRGGTLEIKPREDLFTVTVRIPIN